MEFVRSFGRDWNSDKAPTTPQFRQNEWPNLGFSVFPAHPYIHDTILMYDIHNTHTIYLLHSRVRDILD